MVIEKKTEKKGVIEVNYAPERVFDRRRPLSKTGLKTIALEPEIWKKLQWIKFQRNYTNMNNTLIFLLKEAKLF